MSSAYYTRQHTFILSARSLTYAENEIGPRDEPCGTPYLTFSLSEWFFTKTCRLCSVRQVALKPETVNAYMNTFIE